MTLAKNSLSEALGCLFENDISGFVVVRDGAVVGCNTFFARLLGRDHGGELEGLAFADLAAPGEARELARSLIAPGRDQAGPVGEIYLLGKDQAYVPCRYSRVRQCFPQGQYADVIVLMVQDVTDYYSLLDEYNKAVTDLEEAKLVQESNANMLSDMIVQLEIAEKEKLEKEKLQGIIELAVAAAHELSQPLQAMQNDIFFLRSAVPEGGEESQALDSISEALADLEKIVAKIRKVTTCKTTEYARSVTMLDLDKSSGEDS